MNRLLKTAALAAPLRNSGYGDYLLHLLEGGR